MKSILILISTTLLSATINAQNLVWNADLIPETLKKNASSVKREESVLFEVKSVDKAVYSSHEVVTILNEAGKDNLYFHGSSDKFHSFDDAEIRVYDANGRQLNKYSRKDFYTQSGGEGLVAEGKDYFFSVSAPGFPITVEYNFTVTYKGTYHYPRYLIQSPDQSVQKSTFSVKVPKDLDIRYRQMHTQVAPQIDESDKKYKAYSWAAAELPVMRREPSSGNIFNNFPWISIAPNKFELDGYPGEMDSWKNLGMWYNTLVKNDNLLLPESKQEIKNIASAATTDRERVKLIYEYLQKNYRYVSIQLGIGGFKPFSADFVHKKKYGDCKALSNYMQACLEALNIKSYSAWVTGSTTNFIEVQDDFPSDPFNHQILFVPLQKDTIWLECTSATNDFAVLGSFTENRKALVLTEDGGVLLNTPKSSAAENIFSSKTNIILEGSGGGKAQVQLSGTGEYKQDFINYIGEEKKDDQKKFLVYYLGFMQPDGFELHFDKAKRDVVAIDMIYEKINDFKAGNKLFFNPRLYKLWSSPLPAAEKRTSDYFFNEPFTKTDTTIYKLPEGYSIETLPRQKDLSFDYGNFKSTYVYDEKTGSIMSTVSFRLTESKIPAAKYAATKKFFDEVMSEYSEKIVVKKSN